MRDELIRCVVSTMSTKIKDGTKQAKMKEAPVLGLVFHAVWLVI